jgi:hypothetical protein
MTNSTSVSAHTSGLCPVCHQPYTADTEPNPDADVAAVDHLVRHGRREIAFALLVSEGHRLLAEGAADFARQRVLQVGTHLRHVADDQRPAVVGGEGF